MSSSREGQKLIATVFQINNYDFVLLSPSLQDHWTDRRGAALPTTRIEVIIRRRLPPVHMVVIVTGCATNST